MDWCQSKIYSQCNTAIRSNSVLLWHMVIEGGLGKQSFALILLVSIHVRRHLRNVAKHTTVVDVHLYRLELIMNLVNAHESKQ